MKGALASAWKKGSTNHDGRCFRPRLSPGSAVVGAASAVTTSVLRASVLFRPVGAGFALRIHSGVGCCVPGTGGAWTRVSSAPAQKPFCRACFAPGGGGAVGGGFSPGLRRLHSYGGGAHPAPPRRRAKPRGAHSAFLA